VAWQDRPRRSSGDPGMASALTCDASINVLHTEPRTQSERDYEQALGGAAPATDPATSLQAPCRMMEHARAETREQLKGPRAIAVQEATLRGNGSFQATPSDSVAGVPSSLSRRSVEHWS
jgi:hypothetical protein